MRQPNYDGGPSNKNTQISADEAQALLTASQELDPQKTRLTPSPVAIIRDRSERFSLHLSSMGAIVGGSVRGAFSIHRNGEQLQYVATLDAPDLRPVFVAAGLALPVDFVFEGEPNPALDRWAAEQRELARQREEAEQNGEEVPAVNSNSVPNLTEI